MRHICFPAILVLGLGACGGGDTESAVETPGADESPKTRVLEAGAAVLQDKPPIDATTYGAYLYNPVVGESAILGRSFRIKLWPTVVVLKDGQEVARVVRPVSADEVRVALAQAGGA